MQVLHCAPTFIATLLSSPEYMTAKQKRSRFISFVDALQMDDADIKTFQRFFHSHKRGVMFSSNPYMHVLYLGHHFKNHHQLTGYIKCMLEYFEYEGNMLPEKIAADHDELLRALQCVANGFVLEQNKNV